MILTFLKAAFGPRHPLIPHDDQTERDLLGSIEQNRRAGEALRETVDEVLSRIEGRSVENAHRNPPKAGH